MLFQLINKNTNRIYAFEVARLPNKDFTHNYIDNVDIINWKNNYNVQNIVSHDIVSGCTSSTLPDNRYILLIEMIRNFFKQKEFPITEARSWIEK